MLGSASETAGPRATPCPGLAGEGEQRHGGDRDRQTDTATSESQSAPKTPCAGSVRLEESCPRGKELVVTSQADGCEPNGFTCVDLSIHTLNMLIY